MSEPFIAEIRIFAGDFAPRGWAFCNGQRLPIAQNTALFSLIGTTYGGDGITTMALPDLRGRAAMHPGQGPDLSDRRLGQSGGSASVPLSEAEMATHSHSFNVSLEVGERRDPSERYLGRGNAIFADPANTVDMASESLSGAGEGQPHNNLQPFLALNFIIALAGLVPSRPDA
jgi:microcystin-dependent protein